MRVIRRQIRHWAETLVQKGLRVKVYSGPPFGMDSYAQVRHLFSWSPHDVVFDVGANDGRSVFRMQQYLPSPRIFAFEPVSSTFQTLVERTKHLENVRCFPLALGAERSQQTIYLHEKAFMNSFSADWSEPIGTETVEVSTVDQVMAEQGIEFIHFLKIDTEGHGLEVLKGARDALTSSRVGVIQLEVGIDQRVSPHTSFEDVRLYLAEFGYFLHGVFGQHSSRGRARPPTGWDAEKAASYHPALLKYFDAVFVAARLEGASLQEKDPIPLDSPAGTATTLALAPRAHPSR